MKCETVNHKPQTTNKTLAQNKFTSNQLAEQKETFLAFPDRNWQSCLLMIYLHCFLPTACRQTYELEKAFESLKSHLSTLVYEVLRDGKAAQKATAVFFENLPDIYNTLLKDAEAILKFDPAAESVEEVIVAYPGFFAIAVYRFSNQLWKQEIGILPRLLTEYAHSKTGVDIHPGAAIGESFFIDHGTGIVIGETTVIGKNVKIYQGVTIGALSVSREKATGKRHPTIEDNVIIYSGATILGGETIIGKNSVIGGNVWITKRCLPMYVLNTKVRSFKKKKAVYNTLFKDIMAIPTNIREK